MPPTSNIFSDIKPTLWQQPPVNRLQLQNS